tara:strand:- start:6173 stop:6412 length:240 start_codon:yes stop_codon:yes gene_type:complete
MQFCQCCDTRTRSSSDDANYRLVIAAAITPENARKIDVQINKIEVEYKKYVSGELECTPKEGAIIINNYNSRRKIKKLL